MKHILIIATIVSALAFISCNKDDETTTRNYIQAAIGDQLFTCYENDSLNQDSIPAVFSFTFGQDILTTATSKDTSLFIRTSLNKQSFGINFPKKATAQTYTLYHSTKATDSPSAYYMKSSADGSATNLTGYSTLNMANTGNTNDKKVGEIKISRLDWENRIIEGTFNFTVYGYKISNDTIKALSDSIAISKGEFYYHWSNTLPISEN